MPLSYRRSLNLSNVLSGVQEDERFPKALLHISNINLWVAFISRRFLILQTMYIPHVIVVFVGA